MRQFHPLGFLTHPSSFWRGGLFSWGPDAALALSVAEKSTNEERRDIYIGETKVVVC